MTTRHRSREGEERRQETGERGGEGEGGKR